MTRAGIYVRISQDRAGGGLGIARQEADCRALCERKGWTVADIYPDNDTSAYSGAPRPQWERLIADARAGTIGAIACWHVDRITRSPRELEDVIDLADRLGLQLATATGEVDLSTPTGKMVARILGDVARHEAEHKAERQRREHRQRAEAGRFAGGGHRPFGYDRVYDHSDPDRPRRIIRDEINEREAAILRELADRALAGESLSSMCRDLKARGIQTTAGNHFVPTSLRDVLCSARISGRREHIPIDSYRGKARPLVGEIVADACWPEIIDPDTSDRLRELLTRPERLKGTRATGRKYLLSGILRCGRCADGADTPCGAGLVGRPRDGVPRYVCPNLPGGPSCGKLATVAAPTDQHIRDMVLVALSGDDIGERLRQRQNRAAPPDLRSRISRAENRLAELAADWAGEQITRAEWHAARGVIERQLTADRAAFSRVTHTTALDGWTGSYEDLLKRWEGCNVSQRRALVEAAVQHVVVRPANPRKRWDPDRFEVIWRA